MNRLSLIAFLLLTCTCVYAETIILRTGARVRGTIVLQNEEVVIVRDEGGARFQYPRADVENILTDDAQEAAQEVQPDEQEKTTTKKASVLLEVGAGTVYLPREKTGAFVSVDFMVGSHHIGERHIFIGGGIGFHGMLMDANKYHFLPIQAALRMPILEQKHAPVFGASIGYGIGVPKSNIVGGLYTGLDLGYRYQLNPKTAIGAVCFARFQQAKVEVVETVEGHDYTHKTGRNFISFGAKFTLYF